MIGIAVVKQSSAGVSEVNSDVDIMDVFQKQILVATSNNSFLVFHMYFYMFTFLRPSPKILFMLYTFVGNIKMQRILKVMNKHLRIYDDLRLQLFQLISFPICHIKIWRL